MRASTKEWTPLTLPLESSPILTVWRVSPLTLWGSDAYMRLEPPSIMLYIKATCTINSIEIVPKHFESKKKNPQRNL